jgi:hypothetical protein
MPVMPRPKGKATKVAFDIMGVPGPLQRPKKKPVKIEQRLTYEETRLSK